MYQGKKILAIITARGGSKGVPRKNIRDLGGKPLLAHSIEHLKQSQLVDVFVTSSQDPEILEVAKTFGSRVIVRPDELAQDTTPTPPVLVQALDAVQAEDGFVPDLVVTIQPTSPLRQPDTIDKAIRHLVDGGYDSVMTVQEDRHPYGVLEDGVFKFLDPARRRQDRKPLYRENGAVYVTATPFVRERLSVFGDKIGILPSDEAESLDIDTLHDFALAELFMKKRYE